MSWYPSKVDWWLGFLLAVLPLSLVAVWTTALLSGSNDDLAQRTGLQRDGDRLTRTQG